MLGSVRKSVSLTQGTACAKPTWCEIPRHIKTTPNISVRMEMKLYPEHHDEPLKDFKWGMPSPVDHGPLLNILLLFVTYLAPVNCGHVE